MRILAVDTATELCGVALLEDDRLAAVIRLKQGTTHTRVLMQAIHAVLEKAAVPMAAVDAFAVSRGPGSFTGLRIGIGTVKGLAAATGKPIVGVSTLAVLASQAPDITPLVCSMIDARRGEVYWSVYRRAAAGLIALSAEKAGAPAAIHVEGEDPCLYIGSGARMYASVLPERRSAKTIPADAALHDPDPGVLARIGRSLLLQGHIEDAHRFAPVYLRKSDAELAIGGKSKTPPKTL
jgi:tRNA threonylcarbamoyladenosine biosynthesis protein TsaB